MMQTTAEDREWMLSGSCVGQPPSLFYPDRGQIPTEAKEICGSCLVRDRCLDYSIEIRDWEGVWGGIPGRKRRAIAQARGVRVDL